MFTTTIGEIALSFETTRSLFSPACVDKGTLAMLSFVTFAPGAKVLDLGCGYGVVGIYAAKLVGAENVIMSDNDSVCIEYARRNAAINGVERANIILSDGFRNIDDTGFTHILSNPPYHADFSVPKHFIQKGFNRLALGGKMYMVTRRKDWYKNKLTAIFGGVKIYKSDEYYVFCAEKRGMSYANFVKNVTAI